MRRIISVGLLGCMFSAFSATGCSKAPFVNESEPRKVWTCNRSADEAMLQEDYETGIVLHEKRLEKHPKDGLAAYHLGYAYSQVGDHSKEASYYEKAIGLGFEGERIFFNLGMAYGELHQIERSIHAFEQDTDKNPDNTDTHLGLALAYKKSSAWRRAEEEYLKVIKIDPEDIEARLLLSTLYVDRGKNQKAIDQLRRILEIEPLHAEAQQLLQTIRQENDGAPE